MLITVQPHLQFGGAERQSVLLANTLQSRGHATGVVLHEAKGGLLGELHPEVVLESLGVENHLLTPIVARRLRKKLDTRFASESRSLVALHLWSSLLAGFLADRRADGPFTYVFYEDLDPSDHAEFIRLGQFKQRLIGHVFRRGGVVVANSRRVAEAMVQAYGLPQRPRVVSPGVDLRMLDAVAAPPGRVRRQRNACLRVVTVGSLIPRKGLSVIYEGLMNSGLECEWHVIGEGPLRRWLEDLPRSERVKVCIRGSHPRPYEMMKDMDLMIHGAHSEAFGVVLLEALGLGIPVLSAAASGPQEISETLGQRTEFLSLFPVGDSAALSHALREWVRTSQTIPAREEMQRYIAPYSMDSCADAWIELAREHGCVV